MFESVAKILPNFATKSKSSKVEILLRGVIGKILVVGGAVGMVTTLRRAAECLNAVSAAGAAQPIRHAPDWLWALSYRRRLGGVAWFV